MRLYQLIILIALIGAILTQGVLYLDSPNLRIPGPIPEYSEESLPWSDELKPGDCIQMNSGQNLWFAYIQNKDEDKKLYQLDMFLLSGHKNDLKFVHFLGDNKGIEGISLKEQKRVKVKSCPKIGQSLKDFKIETN